MALGSLLILAGCGASQPGAPGGTPAEPAARPPPGYPLAESEEEPAAPRGADDGVSSSPGPKQPQWAEPPLRREASTVEEALADLDEDEQLFVHALDDAKKAVALTDEHGSEACRRACHALGSMRRSVTAVCRLAGADDPRCARAQGVLGRSEDRIADAGCGCE